MRPEYVSTARLIVTVRAAYVLTSLPALGVVNHDASVDIIDFDGGDSVRADGIVARELARSLQSGKRSPWLAETPLGEEMTRLLRAIEAQHPVPVTAASALRLGGFDTLFLELTGTCNERCVHCYAGSGPDVHTALTYSQCRDAVRDAAQLGFRRIQLTGGEPLLCDFLVELVAEIKAHEMVCEIYTNGTLVRDGLVSRLRPPGPSFALSFYSHRSSVHDRITQVPGSHQRTVRAIECLVAAGLEVRASVVVMPANAGDVPATVALLRRLGVQHVAVAASRAVGRGRVYDGSTLGDVTQGGHRPPAATMPVAAGSLCVASDGRIYPCIFNRNDPLGQLSDRSLRAIAEAPDLAAIHRPAQAPLRIAANWSDQLQCRSCRLTKAALRMCS